MEFRDKTLTCRDCGAQFVFSAGEQEFFHQRGFSNEPSRCPACRAARRNSRNAKPGGSRRMYHAICADCGVETEVPFEPRGDRPVYCRDCYNKRQRR
ncbi:MAG: zinc-ribbon domain containing protein [Anaerolineae bacterium]|nr:zinc-ribbon domain containing protein [Anaerolineae bacterium]MDH7474792.1 zinc-ribbon domain containing protein [Anaerolineae bacterium]